MNKHIPKYVLHNAAIKHHLIRHGFYSPPSSLKDSWYFDINTRKIVIEGA